MYLRSATELSGKIDKDKVVKLMTCKMVIDLWWLVTFLYGLFCFVVLGY